MPGLSKTEEFLIGTAAEKNEMRVKTSDGKTFFVSPMQQVTAESVTVQGANDAAMKRAQEEAEILCEIDELQSHKEVLEGQVDALRDPVLAEARAVRALQRKVTDDEVNLQRLKTSNMDAKELREAEARNLTAKVQDLQAVITQEQEERKDQEDELQFATDEGVQLRREIEDEKRKIDWAKIELRKAESRHEEVMLDQKKLRQQLKNNEELYDEIAATNNDLRVQQKSLKESCSELRFELKRVKANIQSAMLTLSSKGDHSEIRREYEEKLKMWNDLELPAKLQEDVAFMSRENSNLRKNLNVAETEEAALSSSVKMLTDATHRADVTDAMLCKENEALELAIETLTNDAKALLAEEDTWSTDSEGDFDFAESDEGYIGALGQYVRS